MDVRSLVVLLDDGNRIYWICIAIWANVTMGGNRDYELGIGVAKSGTIVGRMVVGRILSGQCDIEPILLIALHKTIRDCSIGLCTLGIVA